MYCELQLGLRFVYRFLIQIQLSHSLVNPFIFICSSTMISNIDYISENH